MADIQISKIGLEAALKASSYFVEADRFSQRALKLYYSDHPELRGLHIPAVSWVDETCGYWQCIPGDTCVSFAFALVDGKWICFYHTTSTVVNWRCVADFLSPYWQRADETMPRKCDADSFYKALAFIRDAK